MSINGSGGSGGRVLIVEDEKVALKNLEHLMKKEGYEVTATQSGHNALRHLDEQEFDVVLTDLRMENVDGIEVLERSKLLRPETEVIMITAYASIPSAVEIMKKGAYDYISKPFRIDDVRRVVRAAMERSRLRRENAELRREIETFRGKVRIVTQDAAMNRLLETARQIAPTDCSIILTGESGTGKELFARYIHYASARSEGPFFPINCGAFTEELLSSELFGHEKGAFTGASARKKGLIESASGGTLFLDEVTEMSQAMQVKLLRVIQEREVLRVGGTEPTRADVRFISATNRDIQEAIAEGRMRQDLYFRLNVVSLRLPSLSERKGDVPILCHYFLRKYAAHMKKDIREISTDVLAILMNYDFPGNVRELENIIERGVALSNGSAIEPAHLPDDLKSLSIRTFRKRDGGLPTLEEQELAYIKWVLKESGGNKTAASHTLGIDRASLWRKLKRLEAREAEEAAGEKNG